MHKDWEDCCKRLCHEFLLSVYEVFSFNNNNAHYTFLGYIDDFQILVKYFCFEKLELWVTRHYKLLKFFYIYLDPYNSLPTRKESKDPKTADAVQSPEDKVLLRRVAPSIVSVSSITHGRVR